MKKVAVVSGLFAALVLLVLFLRPCVRRPAPIPFPTASPDPSPSPTLEATPPLVPVVPTATPVPKPTATPKPVALPDLAPPPVEIFKELIPEDIEIVRVYYPMPFAAPGTTLEFAINGSGFTQAFHDMISVEAGHPEVRVSDLALRTANQISGLLHVSTAAPSAAVYPQVLIEGKVVFRAPEPFYMIRPGEVLFMGIIDHGRFGRSGRLRILTNITPKEYETFRIVPTTAGIRIVDVSPQLPFVVDATAEIGPIMPGSYGLAVHLGDREIFRRDGIINIVGAREGDVGIVQRIIPRSGFHRPGDTAEFEIQGSGFREDSPARMNSFSPEVGALSSTFSFVTPGRINVAVTVPPTAKPGTYSLSVRAGTTTLKTESPGFIVVPDNWVRVVRLAAPLGAGATAQVLLEGRDLSRSFIEGLDTEVSDERLSISEFRYESATQASAEVRADPGIKPGDYWLKVRTEGRLIEPQFGSIIRID